MMTKGSGDNGGVVTYREVVTTGSGDEGKCGPSGDEGKWRRREVVTKGVW